MAAPFALLIVAGDPFATASAGVDVAGAILVQGLAQAVGIVAFLAEQVCMQPAPSSSFGAAFTSLILSAVSMRA